MNYQQFLESTRKLRSKLLQPAGKFLLKLKLTANHLTFLSFILGLAAVYFLFQNPFFFTIFALLHLTADAFDGVLARLTKTTTPGKYFDYLTDQAIAFFLLLKIYFHLNDYYVILIIVLFLISQAVYTLSKFKYPIIFFRTGIMIALMFHPLFTFDLVPIGSYLAAGVISFYSLLLQLRCFLKKSERFL